MLETRHLGRTAAVSLASLVICSAAGCRSKVVELPDDVITYDHIVTIVNETLAPYVNKISAGDVRDSEIQFAVMSTQSQIRPADKLVNNIELVFESELTAMAGEDGLDIRKVPSSAIREALRVAKLRDASLDYVDHRRPEHFQIPDVRDAFMDVMREKKQPVSHMLWLNLSNQGDVMILSAEIFDLREVAGENRRGTTRVSGLGDVTRRG